MYFRYFDFISPRKKAWPFIWTNMNPLHPRILFAKFDWNYPSGTGEEILKFVILNTQECFVPCWVGISPVVLEKKILKFCWCIFLIAFLSSFGKVRGPSFEQTSIYFIEECSLPSLVEIGPVVLENILKFSLFLYYLPMERCKVLHLNKLQFP